MKWQLSFGFALFGVATAAHANGYFDAEELPMHFDSVTLSCAGEASPEVSDCAPRALAFANYSDHPDRVPSTRKLRRMINDCLRSLGIDAERSGVNVSAEGLRALEYCKEGFMQVLGAPVNLQYGLWPVLQEELAACAPRNLILFITLPPLCPGGPSEGHAVTCRCLAYDGVDAILSCYEGYDDNPSYSLGVGPGGVITAGPAALVDGVIELFAVEN